MFAHADDRIDATPSRAAIDAALLRGAVMLTPHLRLARTESTIFDEARRASGNRVWQPANILPWRAWVASLWRDAVVAGVETRVLLNELQEKVLWEQITGRGRTEALRSTASLAQLCASATGLLGAYDLRGEFGRNSSSSRSGTPKPDTFAHWWRAFESWCGENGFLPMSHAETALAEHMRNRRIVPAAEYVLHSLDALAPAQQRLMESLETAGARVVPVGGSRITIEPPVLAACASADDEVARCAAWARLKLERPGARIAIVVPDLEECRPALERALRVSIAPELADVTLAEVHAPYEFSTGRPLSSLPLVADALRLLQWCAGDVSIDDAGAILRSRFLTLAATPERGAELDAFVLRQSKVLRALVCMSRVAGWTERSDAATATVLRTLAAATRNLAGHLRTHAFFADGVRSLLRAAGWTSRAPLNSEEHQAVDRWSEVLDRIASLDALDLRVTLPEFLQRLSEAVRSTSFAPENTDAPLQVTTVAEAVGRDVDALWFLHANERTWPVRRHAHPLLPMGLQRALGMPATNEQQDECAAQQQLHELAGSAASVVFSYARIAGETTQRPSPLVLALNDLTMMPADEVADPDEDVASELECVDDVAPLPPLPEGVVSGGVSVLAAQALCGFRAFAEKRLFSREMEASAAGLSAGDRGDQVHRVLEAFWKATKDQARLKTMSAAQGSDGVSERDRLLRDCIDEVIASAGAEPWESSYLDVQRQRLFRLLTAWLDFEQTRPPFVVEALEQVVPEAVVGPLRLKLRLDRIDRVTADGEEAAFLIDYKTGSTAYTKSDWTGERPNEPQLPVYAIAGNIANVQGVAFAAVKVGDKGNKFEAASDTPALLGAGSKRVDFALQLQDWRADLEQLATQFAEGQAEVAPKEYPKTCDLCGQRMLCRLDTAALLNVEDMDEDDEDGLPW